MVWPENGATHKLDIEGKWSTAIFNELMDLTAGPWWQKWKNEQGAATSAKVPIPAPPRKKTGAAAGDFDSRI